MFETPQIMRMAQQMARHASARQVIIAENVAHADTPGYKARDIPHFAKTLDSGFALRMTRAGHLESASAAPGFTPRPDPATLTHNPNGNTVSLEQQMMRAAETRASHDMALSVYSAARGILRTALGK